MRMTNGNSGAFFMGERNELAERHVDCLSIRLMVEEYIPTG